MFRESERGREIRSFTGTGHLHLAMRLSSISRRVFFFRNVCNSLRFIDRQRNMPWFPEVFRVENFGFYMRALQLVISLRKPTIFRVRLAVRLPREPLLNLKNFWLRAKLTVSHLCYVQGFSLGESVCTWGGSWACSPGHAMFGFFPGNCKSGYAL